MCLLVVAWRVWPGTPAVIGANRDERLDRPSTAMAVLSESGPRILGGRDHDAGGTWFAVNEHGVFAGLTNEPLGDRKDPSRRSRGELPLALVAGTTAAASVEHFTRHHRPEDYNGAWLLAGDANSLFSIDFTGRTSSEPVSMEPGLYVLENRPLGAPSPKVDQVTAMLGAPPDADAALQSLRIVLADHAEPPQGDDTNERGALPQCVHLDGYGTRSSCLIRINDDALPNIWVADGAPCTTSYVDVSPLWSSPHPS